jgi:phosphoribosylglycinamide formyltransferase-1
MKKKPNRIAIFASGNGSNAENIVRYFREKESVAVVLIISNKRAAFVLERASKLGVESYLMTHEDFIEPIVLSRFLKAKQIDFIVLAGYMRLIPKELVIAFPQKILNIHPALLPQYGGKGMYGDFVHQAVSEAGETETGISIHYVNEAYDEGDLVFQKKIAIQPGENPELIAEKVHALEYAYYPQIIEKVILGEL